MILLIVGITLGAAAALLDRRAAGYGRHSSGTRMHGVVRRSALPGMHRADLARVA